LPYVVNAMDFASEGSVLWAVGEGVVAVFR
jgi:hypothetical protein